MNEFFPVLDAFEHAAFSSSGSVHVRIHLADAENSLRNHFETPCLLLKRRILSAPIFSELFCYIAGDVHTAQTGQIIVSATSNRMILVKVKAKNISPWKQLAKHACLLNTKGMMQVQACGGRLLRKLRISSQQGGPTDDRPGEWCCATPSRR